MLEMHLAAYKSGNVGYFIEELTNEQFISYAELSTLAGVSGGVLHNEGSGWLRFEMDDKELIVSKKTIRHSVSWEYLNNLGVAYGSKEVIIRNKKYRVRLLRGADTDPALTVGNGGYLEGSHNSEWSRLFYPLVKDDFYLPENVVNPQAIYTNKDLGMEYINNETTPGTYSWCQESRSDTRYRITRGDGTMSQLSYRTSTYENINFGWRPCLEFIPPTLTKPTFINGFTINASGQYLTRPTFINGFAFTKND